MDSNHKNPYAYLSYVTLREMWEEAKGFFFLWVVVSGVSLGIGTLGEFGVGVTKNLLGTEYAQILPTWAWFVIIFSATSWFMRGEEIKFTFPNLTFKLWLLVTFLIGLIAFVCASSPWWVGVPFYWGVLMAALTLDTLAAKGWENYLKLTENGSESD